MSIRFCSLSALPSSHSSIASSVILFISATRKEAEDGKEPVGGSGGGTSSKERNPLKKPSMIGHGGIDKE
jgi:hypothetical protein